MHSAHKIAQEIHDKGAYSLDSMDKIVRETLERMAEEIGQKSYDCWGKLNMKQSVVAAKEILGLEKKEMKHYHESVSDNMDEPIECTQKHCAPVSKPQTSQGKFIDKEFCESIIKDLDSIKRTLEGR